MSIIQKKNLLSISTFGLCDAGHRVEYTFDS